ncbi:MAG: iron ABC transporter permease, partial [Acidimicrobiia bacterium]|nr:iron ABC transporter permease [Acidimicrobiia bacterium]
VAFVGLLVPFVIRRLIGPKHRYVLPAAMVAGAFFVVAADVAARMVIEPIEVPVGLVTAVIGGPIFIWLLTRSEDV